MLPLVSAPKRLNKSFTFCKWDSLFLSSKPQVTCAVCVYVNLQLARKSMILAVTVTVTAPLDKPCAAAARKDSMHHRHMIVLRTVDCRLAKDLDSTHWHCVNFDLNCPQIDSAERAGSHSSSSSSSSTP